MGGEKEPLNVQGWGERRNLSKVKGWGREGTSQRSKVKCICVHRWRPEHIFTAIEAPSSHPNLSIEDHPEFPQKQRTQPQWWCHRPATQARGGQSIPHRSPSSAQIICLHVKHRLKETSNKPHSAAWAPAVDSTFSDFC